MEGLEGLIYFSIFLWVATIIFTIVLAVKKGYSGILAFLLGLFIPLLGSLIIIALLPDLNRSYSSTAHDSMNLKNISSSPIRKTTEETKICSKCKKSVNVDYTSCPHCGNGSFV
jgi:hypothetical protein